EKPFSPFDDVHGSAGQTRLLKMETIIPRVNVPLQRDSLAVRISCERRISHSNANTVKEKLVVPQMCASPLPPRRHPKMIRECKHRGNRGHLRDSWATRL